MYLIKRKAHGIHSFVELTIHQAVQVGNREPSSAVPRMTEEVCSGVRWELT